MTDYLTEQALGHFLRERIDENVVANTVIPDSGRRFRPDFRSEKLRIVIEFDGPQHYTSSSHVIKDEERDLIIRDCGYETIRIPYFVQLDERIVRLLFSSYTDDITTFLPYPHGFIDSKVIFPSDFCELGVQRYQKDLIRFSCIREDIEASLRAAAKSKGDWRLVYPTSIYSATSR